MKTTNLTSLILLYSIFMLSACQTSIPHTPNHEAYLQLSQKAEQGDAQTQIALGFAYLEGDIVPVNPEKTLFWWTQAAQIGDHDAQTLTGLAYLLGIGSPHDPEKTVAWWQKSANQNDVNALFGLSSLAIAGLGMPQNYQLAENLLIKAARQKHLHAQRMLGLYYYHGLFFPKNQSQAVFWLKEAVKQNDKSSEKLLQTALSGINIPETYVEQLAKTRLSAIHSLKSTDWRYSLGNLYYYGDILQKNIKKAEFWWLKSAEKNHDNAQLMLGLLYLSEQKTPKSYEKSAYWLQKSSNNGNLEARAILGSLYFSGVGVEKNIKKGTALLTSAAEKGSVPAAVILGTFYFSKTIPSADPKQAYIWISISHQTTAQIRFGIFADVQKTLSELEQQLTASEIESAKRDIQFIIKKQEGVMASQENGYRY